jgi:hypothetical protein
MLTVMQANLLTGMHACAHARYREIMHDPGLHGPRQYVTFKVAQCHDIVFSKK